MFIPVDVLADVGPFFEVFVSFFIVLVVLVENSDVNVQTASQGVIFAERQLRQFHGLIVQLLLLRASARRENT